LVTIVNEFGSLLVAPRQDLTANANKTNAHRFLDPVIYSLKTPYETKSAAA